MLRVHLLSRVLPLRVCAVSVLYQMGNNNSSRYGVVTQLQFDDGDIPKMVGSLNRTYLLEKSRVVSRSSRERNFHVFYQMVGSDDEEFKKSLQLSGKMLCFPGDKQGTTVSHVVLRYRQHFTIKIPSKTPWNNIVYESSTDELLAIGCWQEGPHSVEKIESCADGGCSFHLNIITRLYRDSVAGGGLLPLF